MMAKSRNYLVIILVALTLWGSYGTGSHAYASKEQHTKMVMDDEVYHDALSTLKGFLGLRDDGRIQARKGNSSEDTKCNLGHMDRMTQRVTVTGEKGVLPIVGTVTKMKDVFYPGTYEVKFGNKAMLTDKATIQVKMDVSKGEQIYVLTGDKESGYKQYTIVVADLDNTVSFDTSVIQNYTISTTDIIKAQDAVNSMLTKKEW